jgi:hypothetical protein
MLYTMQADGITRLYRRIGGPPDLFLEAFPDIAELQDIIDGQRAVEVASSVDVKAESIEVYESAINGQAGDKTKDCFVVEAPGHWFSVDTAGVDSSSREAVLVQAVETRLGRTGLTIIVN